MIVRCQKLAHVCFVMREHIFEAKIFEMYLHFIISGECDNRGREGAFMLGLKPTEKPKGERKENPKGLAPHHRAPEATSLSHRAQHGIPDISFNVSTVIFIEALAWATFVATYF